MVIVKNTIVDIGSEQVKFEPAVEPGKSKFRIYVKRLFLTYSRTNISPENIYLYFLKNSKRVNYMHWFLNKNFPLFYFLRGL